MVPDQSSELAGVRVVALIPARGGSKGIQQKNLQLVGGVPLVVRAIRTCRASCAVETYVSTEDAEIADVAVEAGANIIIRPPELAADDTPSIEVLLHGLRQMGPQPDVLVWVQCTAPLLTAADIDGCVAQLLRTEASTAVAVTEFHGGVCRAGYAERLVGVNWDMARPAMRRQDRRTEYLIEGSVWALDVRRLLASGREYGSDCVPYVVHRRQLDIDEPDDLQWARLLIPPPPLQYPL